LTGSAGSKALQEHWVFDVFTEPAEELQSCLAAGERDRVQQILEQLYVLVRRVQKGMDAADERSEPIVTRANGG
jgi:hypothetical protein